MLIIMVNGLVGERPFKFNLPIMLNAVFDYFNFILNLKLKGLGFKNKTWLSNSMSSNDGFIKCFWLLQKLNSVVDTYTKLIFLFFHMYKQTKQQILSK